MISARKTAQARQDRVIEPHKVRRLVDEQAGNGVPSENLQDGFQVRRDLVQPDAPAVMILARPAGTSKVYKGPQARNVTKLNAAQINVNLTRHISHAGKRADQDAIRSLIDVP
jgi:hypothetical protein